MDIQAPKHPPTPHSHLSVGTKCSKCGSNKCFFRGWILSFPARRDFMMVQNWHETGIEGTKRADKGKEKAKGLLQSSHLFLSSIEHQIGVNLQEETILTWNRILLLVKSSEHFTAPPHFCRLILIHTQESRRWFVHCFSSSYGVLSMICVQGDAIF